MKSQILTAVVGLGRAGWSIHVEQIRPRPDFKIVDVADPDPRWREEAARALGCATHADLKTLLKSTRAELVVIATPSFAHEGDSVNVLKSGRHCLVEKPMAMDLAGARRMIAASRKAKKKLFVHQNYRFANEFHHLREIIDSGLIGRVFEIRACWFGFARRNDWQTLRKNGGGVLNNTGPHTIDMTLSLMDSPVASLTSDLQHIKDAGDCEDHVHLFLKFRSGQTADLTISTACALPSPKWMLLGSCGTLSCDGGKSTIRWFDPSTVSPLPVIDGPAPDRKYGNEDVLPWKEEVRPAAPSKKHENYYDNVADVLMRGGKMAVTPQSAAEVIRVIEWARKGTRFPALKIKAKKS